MKNFNQIISYNNNFKKKKNFLTKKIKYLFNFNPIQLLHYMEYFLNKKNIVHNYIKSDFDQIYQQINLIKKKNIDILIVGNDFNFFYDESQFNLNDFTSQVFSQIELLNKIKKNNLNLKVIFFNIPYFYTEICNYEKKNDQVINQLNSNLSIICKKYKIILFDYNSTILEVGQQNFYSYKNYYISKNLFTESACNIISSQLSKIISSICYERKKCLILDLDNSLWGGVLGEDGIRGIQIGNSYEGSKYSKFQKYIKNLSNAGIILALVSKNNNQDVIDCFKKNKNLILKLNDFSSIKINWKPKYINVNEIAAELNIGKDSIVFFDDSKFERDQMQKFNPEINTISVPDSVDEYINSIEETAFFYSSKELTKEDLKKKDQYNLLADVRSFRLKFKDTNTYLKSLKMRLTITKVKSDNFSRCVQMLNKTNQFNLTTKRYSDEEFKNYTNNKKVLTFVLNLEDKFGDHGIIGLVTAKISGKISIIENFLLSCRVLGRYVEETAINALILKIKRMNIQKIIGIYRKTSKNIQCNNFYEKLGFKKSSNKKFILKLNESKMLNKKIIEVIYE
jgi:FkbH-like protein